MFIRKTLKQNVCEKYSPPHPRREYNIYGLKILLGAATRQSELCYENVDVFEKI
jgi:hypothetical protein